MDEDRLKDIRWFYALLGELGERTGGPKLLSDCHGRMGWPARGVYFFLEAGETRSTSGIGSRVVRIGTHALKSDSQTALWHRLAQHRGRRKTNGGNHRGSIFRLLVGASLIVKGQHTLPSWDNKKPTAVERASEASLEGDVSSVIQAMPFFWLPIDDAPGPDSLRGYIERNCIALLSNFDKQPIDPPSADWLGRHCDRERVRNSGLWNQNHVDDDYERGVLDTFERAVKAIA